MPTTQHHHHATVNHRLPKQNPKLLSILLKLIIMFLILSIFLIFLGLAAIILLNLLIAGSIANRRRSRRHNAGMQNNLPMFRYSAATTSDDCSICLECFKEGEFCRVLPVCDHLFHAKCVDLWLVEVLNCPVCRAPVQVDGDWRSGSVVDDDSKFLWAVDVGRQLRDYSLSWLFLDLDLDGDNYSVKEVWLNIPRSRK
ncbi:putative transcription factor C2H2 family [Helianthus anomalus]